MNVKKKLTEPIVPEPKKKFRKKRIDRTHIIYELKIKNLTYIGITAKTASTIEKSVWVRARKHYFRSYSEDKQWPLYIAMRKYGFENFTYKAVAVVRGKAEAHKLELEMIKKLKPKLNSVGIKKG